MKTTFDLDRGIAAIEEKYRIHDETAENRRRLLEWDKKENKMTDVDKFLRDHLPTYVGWTHDHDRGRYPEVIFFFSNCHRELRTVYLDLTKCQTSRDVLRLLVSKVRREHRAEFFGKEL